MQFSQKHTYINCFKISQISYLNIADLRALYMNHVYRKLYKLAHRDGHIKFGYRNQFKKEMVYNPLTTLFQIILILCAHRKKKNNKKCVYMLFWLARIQLTVKRYMVLVKVWASTHISHYPLHIYNRVHHNNVTHIPQNVDIIKKYKIVNWMKNHKKSMPNEI